MSSQHTVIVGGSSGSVLRPPVVFSHPAPGSPLPGAANSLVEAKRQLGPEAQAVPMDAAAADALPAQFAQIGRFDHLVLALGSGKGSARSPP